MKHLKYKAPRALVRDLRACGDNYRKLAKMRDVNIYWIVRLFTYGEEPNSKKTRLKLSLPGKKRKPWEPRKPKLPLAVHVRWWREQLSKEERNEILKSQYLKKEADNDRITFA